MSSLTNIDSDVEKPLLSIKNLKVSFDTYNGRQTAVDDVDLKIFSGETLGLVGESGCGKTVTSMSILRLLPPSVTKIKGKILFQGEDLLSLSTKEMRRIRGNAISMIFQEPMTSLNPVMTIGRQLSESIMLHQGVDKRESLVRAKEMLRQVQIPSPGRRLKEYPHKMSGGMRQRVMIAMAISCNPKLLLADEPTTALDVTIQAQIIDLMTKLKEKIGTSIIFISHDLGLIARVATRVVIMYAGQVIEEAKVDDLFANPLHPYTQGLLRSVPVLGSKHTTGRKDLMEIPGVVPSLQTMPSGCRFHPRCQMEKIGACTERQPPLLEKSQTRKVRCWLWA